MVESSSSLLFVVLHGAEARQITFRKNFLLMKSKLITLPQIFVAAAFILMSGFLWADFAIAGAVQSVDEEGAITRAINRMLVTKEGVKLKHPKYHVEYEESGVRFLPLNGAPEWHWKLKSFAGYAIPKKVDAVKPMLTDNEEILYLRGGVLERYLAHVNAVEQQFILIEKWDSDNSDLEISGIVTSLGSFAESEAGWSWRNAHGEVTLGKVKVYDARGSSLPAEMKVTANAVHITVPAAALWMAEYPVTIDPEVGTNDFRISNTGGDGNSIADALNPAAAYNSTNNEYLVVWEANDFDTDDFELMEFEIFGQRIDASTGQELGDGDFRISEVGGTGSNRFRGRNPAVAYNDLNNEYLVVWEGNDPSIPDQSVSAHEIFGQRIDAKTGKQVGLNDIRISGASFGNSSRAELPAIAYSRFTNEYLVVWSALDPNAASTLVTDIFGQRLNASTGEEVGVDDFRISDVGTDIQNSGTATEVSIAYNSINHEYLVAWSANDVVVNGVMTSEREIFGQRIDAITGNELGLNDFRISEVIPDGTTDSISAYSPVVTYNPNENEYLVVWSAILPIPNLPEPVRTNFEIYGQRIDGSGGSQIGVNDFKISNAAGDEKNYNYHAVGPSVAYNNANNEYLVVWRANGYLASDSTTGWRDTEIFGQRIDAASGEEVGDDDFRITDTNGDYVFGSLGTPFVAYSKVSNNYLVTMSATDRDTAGIAYLETEIFGQLLDSVSGIEVGVNDFRISDVGGDRNSNLYSAHYPAVAYSSLSNEYLVVWEATVLSEEITRSRLYQVHGQIINGDTGNEKFSDDFIIAEGQLLPGEDRIFESVRPIVIYDPIQNEFLAAWRYQQVSSVTLLDYDTAVFARRIDTHLSAINMSDIIQVSDVYYSRFSGFTIFLSACFNDINNEYFVVWQADDPLTTQGFTDYEIYAQRIDAKTGDQVGENDFQISDVADSVTHPGSASAEYPSVAYSHNNNQYLVVWQADDVAINNVNSFEHEIYEQLIDAQTGAEIGVNDFRISDAGGTGDAGVNARLPKLAYNENRAEYLVVWTANDTDDPEVTANDTEIFGQLIDAESGVELGQNDFRISSAAQAVRPGTPVSIDVQYNPRNFEYFVTWDMNGGNVPGIERFEREIYGQVIDATEGAVVGGEFIRISDAGGTGDERINAGEARLAYNPNNDEFLAVWSANDSDYPGVTRGESEIFGQLISRASDLSISVSNNTNFVTANQEPLQYSVVTRNHGDVPVYSVTVNTHSNNLVPMSWICIPGHGASCTPSGAGDIVDIDVVLPAGGSVTYLLNAVVNISNENDTVTATAHVSHPSDMNNANNFSTDYDIFASVFADSFETLNNY